MRSKENITSFLNNINSCSLDKKQIKIATTKRKNVLVVASAGSGKTLIIASRVKYLINFSNVNSKDILCISFTNDAVNNLKTKLDNNDVEVLTFHKLALKIIGNKKEFLTEDMLSHIVSETINNDSLYGLFGMDKLSLSQLIVTFINLFKSKGYKLDDFHKMLNKAEYKEKILLKEIMKCYICYETYLNKENIIDFNDMINKAVDKLSFSSLKYKHIIIDEYQDTSYTKFILIKKLKEKTNASIFAVGDDFQSIYRFAGSDIKLFLDFKKYFKFAKIYRLNKTYRNPNDVAKLASKFIMKNPYQIRKYITCSTYYENPIQIVYYDNLNNKINEVIKADNIDNLLILGRSNNDIKGVKVTCDIKYKKLTVHKSKGLGEDFVFIVNLNDSINGFPNKYTDNNILKYVNNYKTYYPYDEERRLFYVALTRCKKRVYLFVPKSNPSIFIKELLKMNKDIFIWEK